MTTAPPSVRIELIQRSLRCFGLGLLGLLPVIGLPMAILALRQNVRVKRLRDGHWNPADRYRFWGAFAARLGISILIIAVGAPITNYLVLQLRILF